MQMTQVSGSRFQVPANDSRNLKPGTWDLSSLGPFGDPPHLAVAVSGGADSMALTVLAHAWARTRGGRITALTVDHGLRAESRAEAEQVAAWLTARGIAHHILTPAHVNVSNNLQEAARQWRYDALAEYCCDHGILHCLLAHHAGDQRETVAHHLARGKTADGAAGMGAVRNYRGVRFLRPLLTTEKSLLQQEVVEWIDDPSNGNPLFARVRTRELLAQHPARHAALSAIAAREGAARTARDVAFASIAVTAATIDPSGVARIDQKCLLALEVDMATRLLADLLTCISGAIHRPRAADTDRLLQTLRNEQHVKRTLHGCSMTSRSGQLIIARETARCEAPVLLCGSGSLRWDKRFRVHHQLPQHFPLTLRALGADGKKQLARRDVSPALPALWHLDALVYVPHIQWRCPKWPKSAQVTIGFAPPKPLAAAPFWCFNS